MGQSLSRLNSNQLIIQLAQFQPTHYLVGPIPTNSLSSRPNSILVDWGLGLILNTQIPGRPYSKDIKLLIGLILTLTLSSRPNSNLLNWVLGLILNTQMPGRPYSKVIELQEAPGQLCLPWFKWSKQDKMNNDFYMQKIYLM